MWKMPVIYLLFYIIYKNETYYYYKWKFITLNIKYRMQLLKSIFFNVYFRVQFDYKIFFIFVN